MKRYTAIWYDMTKEVKRESIDVEDIATIQDAVNAAYKKYLSVGKETPASCLTISGNGELYNA
jgi:hypothetical protein